MRTLDNRSLPPIPKLIGSSQAETATYQNLLVNTTSDVSNLVSIDQLKPLIGRGGYCHVYHGYHLKRGPVALKRPLMDPREYSEESLKAIRNEIEICMGLKHAHVLDFIGTCFIDFHLHLVSPYARNGSLSEYMKTHPNVDRVRILTETADAIAYLHSMGIVHGDIKANNILVGDSEEAQVCDFGLSKLLESQTITALKGAGTLRWKAPELFGNSPRSYETDVYAYGITIAEVVNNSIPFGDIHDDAAVMMAIYRGRRPEPAPFASSSDSSYALIWDIAKRCWCEAADQRISMRQAFNSLKSNRSIPDSVTGKIESVELPPVRNVPGVPVNMQADLPTSVRFQGTELPQGHIVPPKRRQRGPLGSIFSALTCGLLKSD